MGERSLAGEEASAALSRRSNWKPWVTVAVLAAVFACGMIDRVLLSVIVEPLKADLQISDSQFGLVQGAAVAVFYVLFAVPFGWAADKFDRRYVLAIGIVIWSFASATCAFARNFTDLFLARGVVGAGEAAMGPAGYPMIAGLVPARHFSLAMIFIVVGVVSGGALGQMIGGYLYVWLESHGNSIAQLFGDLAPWRVLFLIVSLPGLLLALALLVTPGERRSPVASPANGSSGASGMDFKRFFSANRRFFLCHGLGIGLQQASLFGVILWNNAFLARYFGWAPDRIGATFGSALLVTSISAVVLTGFGTGFLYNRGMRDAHLRWQLWVSVLCIPLLFVGYIFTSSPSIVLTCFCLFNLIVGGNIVAGPTALQLATPPIYRGKATAVYVVLASLLGTAVGPGVIGFFTDHILGDERQVGLAIGICGIAFNALAILVLAAALPASRASIANAERRAAEENAVAHG